MDEGSNTNKKHTGQLGVCYYPEHWPRERWAEDARRMRELGLSYVRVGEFAWTLMEPSPGKFNWEWLDVAIDTLGREGLGVVLGTPTATPPRWLVEKFPEVLPVGADGQVRRFGSRRHYCFTSPRYRQETEHIVTCLGDRYGKHEAVKGWQIDNEYGCHDTVRCYCDACKEAFQVWLKSRHGHVDALNASWGNMFWSMAYREFWDIDLPHLTVTEPNPAHVLDYYRFAASQVASYNRLQATILRKASPGRFLTHNYMGFFTALDPFEVTADLDFASWDSYPLGGTDLLAGVDEGLGLAPDHRAEARDPRVFYARTGHPDLTGIMHDWYRGAGRGRFWVMEQQPGPVNWAPHNPSPEPGMIRLWTWEALAHGAEVVSYFRWRQAPFAQEQMHAGLNRPDYEPDVAYFEARRVIEELAKVPVEPMEQAAVAFVFDSQSDWVFRIQPQGREVSYSLLAWTFYQALRRLGIDVDMVAPGQSLAGYKLVVVPSLPIVTEAALSAFQACDGHLLFGPRSGSKTPHFQVPQDLAPGPLQTLLPLKVTRVESLRPGVTDEVTWDGIDYEVGTWVEHVQTDLEPVARFDDDRGAIYTHGRATYLAFWPSVNFLIEYLEDVAATCGLRTSRLPADLRVRRRGPVTFAFNYGPEALEAPAPTDARFLIGDRWVAKRDVSAWVEK